MFSYPCSSSCLCYVSLSFPSILVPLFLSNCSCLVPVPICHSPSIVLSNCSVTLFLFLSVQFYHPSILVPLFLSNCSCHSVPVPICHSPSIPVICSCPTVPVTLSLFLSVTVPLSLSCPTVPVTLSLFLSVTVPLSLSCPTVPVTLFLSQSLYHCPVQLFLSPCSCSYPSPCLTPYLFLPVPLFLTLSLARVLL